MKFLISILLYFASNYTANHLRKTHLSAKDQHISQSKNNRNLYKNKHKLQSQKHQQKLRQYEQMRFSESSTDIANKTNQQDLSEILFQEWGNYYKFSKDEQTNKVQGKFFINPNFAIQQQLLNSQNKDEKDDFGSINIPDENKFWMIVSKKAFYILSERREAKDKFFDSIIFGDQTNIEILHQGKFDEGYCIDFLLKSKGANFFLCFQSQEILIHFSETLESSTHCSTSQTTSHSQGYVTIQESTINNNIEFNDYPQYGPKSEITSEKQIITQKIKVVHKSEWKVLQDWSSCTQACGGGTQTRQMYCFKGDDGAACDDKTQKIQTRKCNENACVWNLNPNPDVEILRTVVKDMQISKYPQQYQPCVLNIGDLNWLQPLKKDQEYNQKIPARLAMNENTIALFLNDSYLSVRFSVDVKKVVFNKFKPNADGKNFCFTLINPSNRLSVDLCPLQNDHDSQEDIYKDWETRVDLFKNKCKNAQEQNQIKDAVLKGPQVKAKMEQLNRVKNKDYTDSIVQESITKTQETMEEFNKLKSGFAQALKKEAEFQQLIEDEEIQKAQEEITEAEEKLEEVKLNKECVKDEQKKDAEDEIKQLINNGAKTLKEKMEEQMKKIIQQSRIEEKKQIEKRKQLFKKKQEKTTSEIVQIRSQIAESLQDKKTQDFCFQKPQDTEKACQQVYKQNHIPSLIADCKQNDKFCIHCCLNINLRGKVKDDCLKRCENNDQNENKQNNSLPQAVYVNKN